MTNATQAPATTTQVFRVYIKATPEAVWDAIVKPEWTERYGYAAKVSYDLSPGGAYRAFPGEEMAKVEGVPDVVVDCEVIEADPPRRLVQTWRMLMDEDLKAEGFTRLTHEIEPLESGVTKLTLIHELEGAPKLAALVGGEHESEGAGGGWSWVLSGMKTVLETGAELDR